MKTTHPSTKASCFSLTKCLIAATALLACQSAHAATDTWSGATNGTWDTVSSDWLNDGTDTLFNSGNDALFTGTPTNNVTAATGLTIGAITLDSSFTGSVTLTGANTVTGPTTLNGGMLAISADNQLGTSAITLGGGTLRLNLGATAMTNTHVITVGASGGTIQITSTSGTPTVTLGGNLAGSGTLNLIGNGTLAQAGSAGASVLNMNASNGSYSGNVVISNGGIVEFGNATAIPTTSTFTVNNLGMLSTNGPTIAQNVNVNNGGTIAFQNVGTGIYSGTVTLTGSATVRMQNWWSSAVQNGTISGNILGTGSLNVNAGSGSGGTLTLTGTNNYSGNTSISTSTLSIGGAGVLGNGSYAGNISNAGTLNYNSTANQTLSGSITGSGALTKGNTGTLTLSGSNGYTGATTVSAGKLNLTGTISASTTVAVGSVNNTAGGAVYQSGNSVMTNTSGGGGGFQIGSAAGARGYYNLSGGTVNVGGEFDPGGSGGGAGTFGQFDMSGGTMNLGTTATNQTPFFLPDRGGAGEVAVVNISGGTVQINPANTATNTNISGLAVGLNNVGNLTSTVTISGSGQFLTPGHTTKLNDTNFGASSNATNLSVLNLDGGTFQTLGFGTAVNAGGGNGSAVINFDGGTLKAGSADNSSFLSSLGTVNIYAPVSGTNTIDNNGRNITIGQALLAATGTGVSSVAISGSGSDYVVPPQVIFSGGTITGGTANQATGYATIDPTNGVVSGIVITNPGTYSSTTGLTVSLSGTTSGTVATLGTLNTAANTSGGMTFKGAGTTTLSGVSTYTGVTNVTGGALTLTGASSINGSSGITVNGSGAKFVQASSVAVSPAVTLTQGTVDGTGTINTVNVANLAGNTVQNGNGGTSTLTIGALTFNGAATVNIADSGTPATVGIRVTGALTTTPANGQVTINATNSLWTSNTTYNLISYGSFSGALSDFTKGTISNLTSRQSAALGTSGSFITLVITGDSPKWTGLDNGNWLVGSTGTNSNWILITGTTATNFVEGDVVLFDDSAAGTTTLTISGSSVSPASTTFNNSTKNYTISGAGIGIAGAGSLTKSGTGTVELASSNSYTGVTTVSAGKLILSGSNSGIGATNVSSTLQLVANSSNGGAVAGGTNSAIGSSSALTLNNGSTLALVSDNNTTFLPASTSVASGATVTITASALTSGSNKTFTLGNTTSMTANGVNGTLNVSASNGDIVDIPTLSLLQGGANDTNRSTLNVASGNTLQVGTVTANSVNHTLAFTGSGNTLITGPISQIQANRGIGLLFNQTGTVTLSGTGTNLRNNNNSGSDKGVTLNSGTVNFNSTDAIRSTSSGGVTFNINGGTVDNTSGVAVTLTRNGTTNINGDFAYGGTNDLNLGTNAYTLGTSATTSRTITTSGTATLTIGGAIAANSNGITKAGTGTLTLSGSNTYTGATNVNAGTLNFAQPNASVVTLTGGLSVATSGTAVLTAHTGGAANVKVLDITGLTINGTTAFAGDGGKDLGGLVSPAPVPEPETIGLLAIGAIGGALLRRRNRKTSTIG